MFVNGVIVNATEIRFNSNGFLKFYKTADGEKEIPNYDNCTINFVTYDNIGWYFKDGKFVFASPADLNVTFSYCSGTVTGKNGYTLTFRSDGIATSIRKDGVVQSYPEGQNWINVSSLRVYANFTQNPDQYTSVSDTAQIGITGKFEIGAQLNLCRSTSTGSNLVGDVPFPVVRVVDETNQIFWFFNGLLTDLTDEDMGLKGGDPNVTYYSGTITGKNGYDFLFNTDGYARCIEYQNDEKDYGPGSNYINVSAIRIYPDFKSNSENYTSITATAQLGITGAFTTSSRINLARSTSSGTNQLTNRYLWMRVIGEDSRIHWIYDGHMTPYTDEDMGLEQGDPDVTYYSGTVTGKNGYDLLFSANGYARCIEYQNDEKDYGAGNNYINVSAIRIYPDFNSNSSNYISITATAQLGITGAFTTTSRINLARSTTSGANRLTSRYLWMRVVDELGEIHWLYDGRMTPNTDVTMGLISYRSGTIAGKNNYGLLFRSTGYAKSVTLSGTEHDYGSGSNWINVSAIRIYRNKSNMNSYESITATAQLGITGTFTTTSRINLARSTSSGTNKIGTTRYLLVRVLDENGNVYWLYDGRLTTLTDAMAGI